MRETGYSVARRGAGGLGIRGACLESKGSSGRGGGGGPVQRFTVVLGVYWELCFGWD